MKKGLRGNGNENEKKLMKKGLRGNGNENENEKKLVSVWEQG
jgi:hypothetical protein